jgi:hypothetical protein
MKRPSKELIEEFGRALGYAVAPNVRDILVVSLGAALVRMESEGLTVGQTADLLIKMLGREGYAIQTKEVPDGR